LSAQDDGNETGGQGTYDLALAINPLDSNQIVVGGINTFKSLNRGLNWSPSNVWTDSDQFNTGEHPVVHADKHFLA